MRTTKHIRRGAAAVMTLAAAAVLPLAVASAGSASAKPPIAGSVRPLYNYGPWTVENSPGTWDSSPNRSYSNGVSLANGQKVTLECYYFGAPAGPYGNTLWYEVGFDYWINDHYLNTPGTAASPQPQTPHCFGSGSSSGGEGVGYGPIFTAENSPGHWGNSPTFALDVSGIGVGNGNSIGLGCYYFGNATGPYGNTLWYLAEDITNNTFGWINDHYLNTPGTAASPQPQTPRC